MEKLASPVSMKEIARRAGVAQSTVSRILSGAESRVPISEETRARVAAVMKEMSYRPNLLARRLRSVEPHSLFIALATASQAPLVVLSSVYYGAVLYASSSPVPIQLTVEPYGRGQLKDLPGLLSMSRFNGAIIANSSPEDDRFLASQGVAVPVIVFNRRVDGCNYIDSTNAQSGRLAAEYLIQRGRRHLCVLYAAMLTQSTDLRRQAFLEAAQQHGLPRPAEAVGAIFSEDGGYEAMTSFLATGQPCDAVFCVGDYMAVGAMHALRVAGRRIPDDVSVIGHDNVDMTRYTVPPLTTFDLPLMDMAQAAMAALVGILTGEVAEPVQQVFETRLVIRESA
jgi:DNA-binding LacI/PurR family transcriptional regulator